MKKKLKDFFYDLADISYSYGEYDFITNNFKATELQGFIDCFMPGTTILSNGINGAPLVLKGAANTDLGTTGMEELELHHYQLYDFSDNDGNWAVVTFLELEELEAYLLSEAGYLNYYSTQMLVFEEGVHKPFEVMFKGDFDTVVSVDKDQIDAPLDIVAMKDKIYVRWIDPKEREALTDADVEAYKKSLEQN